MKITQDLLLHLALAGSSAFANAQSSYTCPGDNGKTIVKAGKKYELHCAEGIKGMPMKSVPGTSADQCAELCAAETDCIHVTFNEKTSMCDLKKNGDLFPYTKQPYMTWYFLENVTTPPITGGGQGNTQQPITGGNSGSGNADTGNQASYACPQDNLKTYTVGDVTYELQCGNGHSVGHWTSEQGTDLKACADRCAAIPECNSCDFDRTSKICYFKKAPSITTPWASGDAWYRVSCPKVRATQANPKPERTTDLSCPKNDGKIFEGSDGTWFYLQCCTDTDGASILGLVTASSHNDCLEKCVADKACKSVTYADSDGSNPNCKLYGHGKFSLTAAPGAHHAFVTDPPTDEPKISNAKLCSTECPDAHGQLFVSVTGENFQMTCDKRHGTTYLKIDRRPSFEACMSSCAAMPACHSAEYEPRTKKCFYGNNYNQPAIDAKAFVSAHSLGCAGACSSCKKGCDGLSSNSLPADAAGCDADHGKLITSGGEDFRLQCRHCYRSNSGWKAAGVTNMADCAKACAAESKCHGANWLGPATGCWLHPAVENDGSAVQFYRDARCDSLMPQSRSLADFENVKKDEPEITLRDW